MADALILETTFLVDLEREQRKGAAGGPARSFLERHGDDRLVITPTIVGELAVGFADDGGERLERFLAPFRLLEIDRDVCWHYSRIYRHLRDNGVLIGANDTWIAATARAHGMPVVTGNETHFRRVPGVTVLSHEH